jgi:hypothetical protein
MRAVSAIDAWLDTMRTPFGYGGPVVHWWQQCLLYTGAGLDWRYEGIIAGYLHLWKASRDRRWLDKACLAGNDLCRAQNINGNFPASTFERNPASGGTPHEAACDAGLLLLARTLRTENDPRWQVYYEVAKRNIEVYLLGRLWHAPSRTFWDHTDVPSFVPNKAATICDALFLLADLESDDRYIRLYIEPTLDLIIAHQVRSHCRLRGAIAQNSLDGHRVEKYFPIYIARCVPTLLAGYQWTGCVRYRDAAVLAVGFLARWIREDGALPTVVYGSGAVTWTPTWIAPLGDVLRAAEAVAPLGVEGRWARVLDRLLQGQTLSGAIRTADGFGGLSLQNRPADFRDLLGITGWIDKAFRYLTTQIRTPLTIAASSGETVLACTFQGRELTFHETPWVIEVYDASRTPRYRWQKGEPWAQVAEKEFWLR